MARIIRRRVPTSPTTTVVFTSADTSYTIPVGVTNLTIVSGYGGMGALIAGEDYYDTYSTFSADFDPGYGTDYTEPRQYAGRTFTSSSPGPDYCTYTYSNADHATYITCFEFYFGNTGDGNVPGPSATGFTKTFPGSLGPVAQTPTTFTNVAVTAGAVMPLDIPAGGQITITFLTPP